MTLEAQFPPVDICLVASSASQDPAPKDGAISFGFLFEICGSFLCHVTCCCLAVFITISQLLNDDDLIVYMQKISLST